MDGPVAHDIIGAINPEHDVDGLAPRLQHGVERLTLWDRAREAVEQEALFAVPVANALRDHRDHDLVADEAASLHHGLDLLAELRAVFDLLAEHVARRKLRCAVELHQSLGLRALTGAGRSKQNDPHDAVPLEIWCTRQKRAALWPRVSCRWLARFRWLRRARAPRRWWATRRCGRGP